MSGSNQEEHEQNMLALDVAARDGDDAIVLGFDEPQEVGRMATLISSL